MEKKRKAEAEVRERQRRQYHQQRLIEPEESEDEHSVFNQVRTMMDEIRRDRAIITDLANQVTPERIVVSDLANKMKQQAKSVRNS